MTVSSKGVDLIKSFEGYSSTAYQDTGGVWTIGYGTIKYPDGTDVKKGDTCTKDEAINYLQYEVNLKTAALNRLITATLNQNQTDSLISFAYNVGVGAFQSSTLLKKVNANPSDPTIRNEFGKWVKDNGRVISGLRNRRLKESTLYFSAS